MQHRQNTYNKKATMCTHKKEELPLSHDIFFLTNPIANEIEKNARR
jgi:hypothetical protein